MIHKKIRLTIAMLSSFGVFSGALANDNQEQNVCTTCQNPNNQNLLDQDVHACPFYDSLSGEEKVAFDQFVKDLRSIISENNTDFSNIQIKHISILEKYKSFKSLDSIALTLTYKHSIVESDDTDPKNIINEVDLALKEFFKTLNTEETTQLETLLTELNNTVDKISEQLDAMFTSEHFKSVEQAIKNTNKILKLKIELEQPSSLVSYSYQRTIKP